MARGYLAKNLLRRNFPIGASVEERTTLEALLTRLSEGGQTRHVNEFEGETLAAKMTAGADWLRARSTVAATGSPDVIAAVLDVGGLGLVELSESLNFQNINGIGWGIIGEGTAFLLSGAGKYGLDMLGSRWGTFRDITIYGSDEDSPAIGILFGRLSTVAAANMNWINVHVIGYFSECCMHNFGSEVGVYFALKLQNRYGGASTCMRLDGAYHYELESEFNNPLNVPNTAISTVIHTFYGADFRAQIGGHAVEIIEADQIRFVGGYMVAKDKHAILFKCVDQSSATGLHFDVHVEPSNEVPGHIEFQGTSLVTIRDFSLSDQNAWASQSNIYVSSDMNLILQGVNIQFGLGQAAPNGFVEMAFPGNVEISGSVKPARNSDLSTISKFMGDLWVDNTPDHITLPAGGDYRVMYVAQDGMEYMGRHTFRDGIYIDDPGTELGYAQIVMDGDLKVIFGDGLSATLATHSWSLGSELVSNGAFGTDTVWSKGTGCTIAGGKATHAAGAASQFAQSVAVTPGTPYLLVVTVTDYAAGYFEGRLTGGATVDGPRRTATGTYSTVLVAETGNTTLQLFGDALGNWSVDNVSLKEILL